MAVKFGTQQFLINFFNKNFWVIKFEVSYRFFFKLINLPPLSLPAKWLVEERIEEKGWLRPFRTPPRDCWLLPLRCYWLRLGPRREEKRRVGPRRRSSLCDGRCCCEQRLGDDFLNHSILILIEILIDLFIHLFGPSIVFNFMYKLQAIIKQGRNYCLVISTIQISTYRN